HRDHNCLNKVLTDQGATVVAKHQPKINDNMTAKHPSNSLAVDSQASAEEEATAAKASAQMTMAAKLPPRRQPTTRQRRQSIRQRSREQRQSIRLETNNVVKMFKLSIDKNRRRPQ